MLLFQLKVQPNIIFKLQTLGRHVTISAELPNWGKYTAIVEKIDKAPSEFVEISDISLASVSGRLMYCDIVRNPTNPYQVNVRLRNTSGEIVSQRTVDQADQVFLLFSQLEAVDELDS
jgi:hypothetical protein